MRNHDLGLREIELLQRQAQNLAARRVFAREQVERRIHAEFDGDDSVFKVGELGPLAVGVHQIVRELAAIAIGDGSEQPAAVVTGVELNLGDAREIFADDVGVLFRIRAELVKINLLVEVGVFGRALVALRITRVVETGTVGLPRDAAAAGGEVHARNNVTQFLARSYIEEHARSCLPSRSPTARPQHICRQRKARRNPPRAILWRWQHWDRR